MEETIQPYGTNIFYDVIPFEMMKTYETEPQLIVTVDERPAVCKNMTCNVAYIEPTTTEVTGYTYDSSTELVTITGVLLPTTIDDMQGVKFAQTNCIIDEDTMTETGMQCTLDSNPVCGEFIPKVISKLGLIPSASDVTATSVTCTITSVVSSNSISSSTGDDSMNVLGGDNITFTGTNFPKDLTQSSVNIKFSNTLETACVP